MSANKFAPKAIDILSKIKKQGAQVGDPTTYEMHPPTDHQGGAPHTVGK